MGILKKILLQGLPKPLAGALVAHLSLWKDTAVRVDAEMAGESFDLVVTTAGSSRKDGVPMLHLPAEGRFRLGRLLRDMEQRLANPALYLDEMEVGGLRFDPASRMLATDREEISLTDRETDILVYLARHRDMTVARDTLLKAVFGYQDGIDTHTLETHIYRLRQKMGPAAEMLKTEDGGYCLSSRAEHAEERTGGKKE